MGTRGLCAGVFIVCVAVLMASVAPEVCAQGRGKKKRRAASRHTAQVSPAGEKGEVLPEKTNGSIQEERQRLARLRNEIAKTKRTIDQMSKKETLTSAAMQVLQRRADALRNAVVIIESHIHKYGDSLAVTQHEIDSLDATLGALRVRYRELLQAIQTSGEASDEELMGNAKGYEAEERNRAQASELTRLAGETAKDIASVLDRLKMRKVYYDSLYVTQERLKEEKQVEQSRLTAAARQHETSLAAIRKNKSELAQAVREKEESARRIRSLMALLIQKEKKRRQEEARREEQRRRRQKPTGTRAKSRREEPGPGPSRQSEPEPAVAAKSEAEEPPQEQPRVGGRSFARKSLQWPVSSRKIVQPFGRYVNPATKVATDNIGIGIGIPAGSAVRCAWEGRVSLVHWLPGYGSLVIVEHAGDYRTVYANLSSVMVTEGQRLGRGEVVGRSGRATDGEYVHFEVWHNTNLLNPGEWLQ